MFLQSLKGVSEMIRRCLALLVSFALLASLFLTFASALAQPSRERRALLIASDHFLTQSNTWPASSNNVKAVENAFSQSAEPFESITVHDGTLNSYAALHQAVQQAFGSAGPEDVSYFYISTHGFYDPARNNLEACLFLSDGQEEATVSAVELERCFEGIPGKKVILIDACQSGAIIGKGISGGTTQAAFLGPDFKVLTSAGGSEDSWYWSTADTEGEQAAGSSYFSGVLCQGIGAGSGFEADRSRDGVVTLAEIYDYLMENHSASTPQVYPQGDDFPFFTYDLEAYAQSGPTGLVAGIQFEETLLEAQDPTVNFSFTVTRPVQLAYQLVYYRDNRWQFDAAQLIYDDQELGGDYGDRKGFVAPGRKVRSLTLSPLDEDTYGYAMVQLITFHAGQPVIHASRVLCVPPAQGDPLLEVKTAHDFAPGAYRELPILVNHQYPCQLSVNVYAEDGQLVARLASYQSTRPQQLLPLASAFYWNGKTTAGDDAAAGKYYVAVKADLGEERFEARSDLFELIETAG